MLSVKVCEVIVESFFQIIFFKCGELAAECHSGNRSGRKYFQSELKKSSKVEGVVDGGKLGLN